MISRLFIFIFCMVASTASFANNERQCIEVINLFLGKQNLGSFENPKKHKSSRTYDVKALGMLGYEKFATKLKPDELNKMANCAAWEIAVGREGMRDVSHKLKEKILSFTDKFKGNGNGDTQFDLNYQYKTPMGFNLSEQFELAYLAIGGSCDENEEMSQKFNEEYVLSMYPNLMVYNIVDGSFAENAGFNPKVVEVVKFTKDDKFVVAKENGKTKGFAFYEGESPNFYTFNEKCEVNPEDLDCDKPKASDPLCKQENKKYVAKPAADNKPVKALT